MTLDRTTTEILCLHDLPSLSPKLCFFVRSGPPFVIRSVLIGWGCPGLQTVDLSERENIDFGGERGEIVQTHNRVGQRGISSLLQLTLFTSVFVQRIEVFLLETENCTAMRCVFTMHGTNETQAVTFRIGQRAPSGPWSQVDKLPSLTKLVQALSKLSTKAFFFH